MIIIIPMKGFIDGDNVEEVIPKVYQTLFTFE
jgi:hypothetical protein